MKASRPVKTVIATAALAAMILTPTLLHAASTCPFDTGGSDAINDGVVLTRYALGITGAPLIASTRYTSLDPLQVKANIECVGCALDINGDGIVDTVDTTIIARHLAGFRGASLTAGLSLGSGTRNTSTTVASFLVNGCAVGGAINAFVLGGNAFGVAAVIGTTDVQPLTVQSGDVTVKLLNSRGDGLRVEHRAGADFTNSPATINGHHLNSVAASASGGTIAGGGFADGVTSSVNTVTGGHGTIGGGANNSAGYYGTISGGNGNVAGSAGTVSGGTTNIASGSGSTIAGGQMNTASGGLSFAAGAQAVADRQGAFVWSDASATSLPFKTSLNWVAPYGDNTFNVRATGGVLFATSVNATTGIPLTSCYLGPSGTGWICSSDRNLKERFEPITPLQVLAGVIAMPVSTWSIIGSKVRQMGPMAQDFYRAFGLGDTDKAINTIDVGGVAFAAIQGLNEKLTNELKRVRTELAAKRDETLKLRARLATIEKKLGL